MKSVSELPQEITILHALLNVKKDHPNGVDAEDFYRSVCLEPSWNYDWDTMDKGLKRYSIISWMCTDTTVGFYAVYLHGELVGSTLQTSRKGDTQIEYISKEAALKVRDFLLTCLREDKETFSITPVEELDKKISIFTSTHASCQQWEKRGFVDGRACTVIHKVMTGVEYYTSTELKVKFDDNDEIRDIQCEDFKTLIGVNL